MLTREQFLSRADLPRREVAIPELGGSVYVRALTAGERDRWELEYAGSRKTLRAAMAALSVCDAEGNRLFAEADIPALDAMPAAPLSRIWDAAFELNKLTKDDVDRLEGN